MDKPLTLESQTPVTETETHELAEALRDRRENAEMVVVTERPATDGDRVDASEVPVSAAAAGTIINVAGDATISITPAATAHARGTLEWFLEIALQQKREKSLSVGASVGAAQNEQEQAASTSPQRQASTRPSPYDALARWGSASRAPVGTVRRSIGDFFTRRSIEEVTTGTLLFTIGGAIAKSMVAPSAPSGALVEQGARYINEATTEGEAIERAAEVREVLQVDDLSREDRGRVQQQMDCAEQVIVAEEARATADARLTAVDAKIEGVAVRQQAQADALLRSAQQTGDIAIATARQGASAYDGITVTAASAVADRVETRSRFAAIEAAFQEDHSRSERHAEEAAERMVRNAIEEEAAAAANDARAARRAERERARDRDREAGGSWRTGETRIERAPRAVESVSTENPVVSSAQETLRATREPTLAARRTRAKRAKAK